jgi:pimeloyl-ACP methyl ester carboxylesterase
MGSNVAPMTMSLSFGPRPSISSDIAFELGAVARITCAPPIFCSSSADTARRQLPSGSPDYPGYGHSDWPTPKQLEYIFDHIASMMDDFTQALGLSHYTPYMQDYGGPVGFRMALAHRERVQALIVQDAVAHNEGLGQTGQHGGHSGQTGLLMKKRCARTCCRLQPQRRGILGTIRRLNSMTPTSWTDKYAFLNASGQAQIQSDLF